jgi:hypothetical protein
MAAAKCLAALRFCTVRVTPLNDDGTPNDAGEYYVSDKTVTLGFTPDISAGADREIRNGCDCIIAASKAQDILKRFTFQLDRGVLEPALEAMLLAQESILDPVDAANVIGVNFSSDLAACVQGTVALEGWAQAEDLDHPDPDFPWWHFRWPWTQWQLGPGTLGADYFQPQVTGFNRANPVFGDPYLDLPASGTGVIANDFFGYWLQAEDPPSATCGIQTLVP